VAVAVWWEKKRRANNQEQDKLINRSISVIFVAIIAFIYYMYAFSSKRTNVAKKTSEAFNPIRLMYNVILYLSIFIIIIITLYYAVVANT